MGWSDLLPEHMCAFQRYLLVGNLKDLALTSTAQEGQYWALMTPGPDFTRLLQVDFLKGEGPEFPLRKRPLDRLVLWCCHMTWARRQYSLGSFSPGDPGYLFRYCPPGKSCMRRNWENRGCPKMM